MTLLLEILIELALEVVGLIVELLWGHNDSRRR